ncbi:oxidoreductase [Prosthecomicrobium hirschii]|uniref:Oxidoreductase n=1 Tax=Prosthecodimorpha hirschii TaxID=665126 RepID=A0A0P6VPA3_9HYPH|nr:FAD-binding protein [Prosthecomicrobium hirschii]KPL54650.1 oxidoreductase [Prosthecomicrobium hirschii]
MAVRSASTGSDRLQADVLVIGGGPAGAWAAFSAAQAGAKVVLADKGYFGTSGATAPSNTGTWCVPPGEGRAHVVERRWQRTGGLAEPRWMTRCVDRAYESLLRLVEWGYPFPTDDTGQLYIANLRGPDYMRFMRRQVQKAGVVILDHHPVLELLSDGEAVTGAAGIVRATGADWTIDAGAVVLATGGVAFFERILGGTGLTGDGYLMAVEAGASLSGMEFTGKYSLAPMNSSLNKGLPFRWASFFGPDGRPLLDRDGHPLQNGIGAAEKDVARALIRGPVLARLDLADEALQDWLLKGQPNCFLPYQRAGIDPFRDLFEVTLKAEGTVRGSGGIRLATDDCGVGVPGLYAAGDAATRELMAGASSGGGAINASWAIASGWWSGHGAAQHARRRCAAAAFRHQSKPLGRAGLRPSAAARPVDQAAVVEAVRSEVIPLDRNYFRNGPHLDAALARLDGVWDEVSGHLVGEGRDRLRAREVAAVTASARWSVAAAAARGESRGMHRRTDRPETDPASARRLIVDGLDVVAVRPEAEAVIAGERAS